MGGRWLEVGERRVAHAERWKVVDGGRWRKQLQSRLFQTLRFCLWKAENIPQRISGSAPKKYIEKQLGSSQLLLGLLLLFRRLAESAQKTS